MVLLLAGLGLGRLQSAAAAAGKIDPVALVVRSATDTLARPMDNVLDGSAETVRRLREGDRIVRDNEALRARLNALELYENQIDLLKSEVENLRVEASLGPLPGKERISADVIDFAQNEGRLTLSVGSERGITPNMPVISSDGLVAIVQTVWRGGCQAALISNVGVQVGGLDLTRKPPTEGLLKGRDPSTLVLTMFDPKATIGMGDTIVTSGHSDHVPRLLRIGKVISIENDPDFGIRRATVVPFFNPGTLKEVQILK